VFHLLGAIDEFQRELIVEGRQSAAQDRATAIEGDRRHDELTPVFEASCEVAGDPGDSATLKIALADGIDALDEVVITVQDESGTDHWGRGLLMASRGSRLKRSSGARGSSMSTPARR
jgi:hypothetical protein